jgi:predicted anti-sigma-YlaC factor YlaD
MADFEGEIHCHQVVEIATDYLEGTLSPAHVKVVEQHLDLCEGCRNYLHQMRVTIAAVGSLREDDVPPEMRDRLLAAFRDLQSR